MTKIIDIEGIGPKYSELLINAGIETTDVLLEKCATPELRAALASELDVTEKMLLEWANRADLMRISGVGEEYSDLLEAAGVDTVVELGGRVAANLHAKMIEVNEEKELVRAVPSLNDVEDWVSQAKSMDRAIHY